MKAETLIEKLHDKLPQMNFAFFKPVDPKEKDVLVIAVRCATNQLAVSFKLDEESGLAYSLTTASIYIHELQIMINCIDKWEE